MHILYSFLRHFSSFFRLFLRLHTLDGAICPIPLVIVAGAGTDAACKTVDGIKAVFLGALFKIERGLGPVSFCIFKSVRLHILYSFLNENILFVFIFHLSR